MTIGEINTKTISEWPESVNDEAKIFSMQVGELCTERDIV